MRPVKRPADRAAVAANRIRVFLRVRPRLDSDPQEDVLAVECKGDTDLQVELRSRSVKDALVTAHRPSSKPAAATAAKQYTFDACLGPTSTHDDVYAAVRMDDMVGAALDGYSSMLFAFGQTGSGKTHTVIGPSFRDGDRSTSELSQSHGRRSGLLGNSIHGAFNRIQAVKERDFEVSITVAEVYNETVSDLLGKQQNAVVRQDAKRGFYVAGLRRVVCKSAAHAESLLERALVHRRTRGHLMNAQSSRSHAIVTVHLDSWASSGSREDADAQQGERLFGLIERARQINAGGLQGRAADSAPPATHGIDRAEPASGVARVAAEVSQGAQGDQQSAPASPEVDCAVLEGSAARHMQRETGGGVANAPEAPRRMKKYGKLVLVDLSGSERLQFTGSSEHEALKETGAINKSLFTLGQVLQALGARGGGARPPVPYRNSTLTQLLWDDLQGSAQTTMLACVNPLSSQVDQTARTLHFATVALRIPTKPVVHVDPHDKVVMELKQTISSLQQENSALTRAFLWLSSGGDWDRAIAELPAHVSQQLPDPVSRTPVNSNPPDSPTPLSPAHLDRAQEQEGWCESAATKASVGAAGVRRELPQSSVPAASSLPLRDFPKTGPGRPPPGRPSSRKDRRRGDAGGIPTDFPELARMEAEFKSLLASENAADLRTSTQQSEDNPSGQAAEDDELGGNGGSTTVSPAVIRDVLDRLPTSIFAADDCASPPSERAEAGPLVMPDADAVLWAVRNIWFGEDAEMTRLAFMIHEQLVAANIELGSALYYTSIETGVARAFPRRWAAYGSTGRTMNVMKEQQGVSNGHVNYEHVLQDRACWATMCGEQALQGRALFLRTGNVVTTADRSPSPPPRRDGKLASSSGREPLRAWGSEGRPVTQRFRSPPAQRPSQTHRAATRSARSGACSSAPDFAALRRKAVESPESRDHVVVEARVDRAHRSESMPLPLAQRSSRPASRSAQTPSLLTLIEAVPAQDEGAEHSPQSTGARQRHSMPAFTGVDDDASSSNAPIPAGSAAVDQGACFDRSPQLGGASSVVAGEHDSPDCAEDGRLNLRRAAPARGGEADGQADGDDAYDHSGSECVQASLPQRARSDGQLCAADAQRELSAADSSGGVRDGDEGSREGLRRPASPVKWASFVTAPAAQRLLYVGRLSEPWLDAARPLSSQAASSSLSERASRQPVTADKARGVHVATRHRPHPLLPPRPSTGAHATGAELATSGKKRGCPRARGDVARCPPAAHRSSNTNMPVCDAGAARPVEPGPTYAKALSPGERMIAQIKADLALMSQPGRESADADAQKLAADLEALWQPRSVQAGHLKQGGPAWPADGSTALSVASESLSASSTPSWTGRSLRSAREGARAKAGLKKPWETSGRVGPGASTGLGDYGTDPCEFARHYLDGRRHAVARLQRERESMRRQSKALESNGARALRAALTM